MAHRCTTPIDRLAAPDQDGEVLVWPEESLRSFAEHNRAALAGCKTLINGQPIPLLRSKLSGPLQIMTGHQPAFFHAGVWAKNIAATACGGEAVFLVVDSDQSQGVALSWPVLKNELWTVGEAVAVPDGRALSFEQLPAISDAAALWKSIPSDLRRSTLLSEFEKAYIESPAADHVSRWTHAMSTTEKHLGISPIRYERLSEHFLLRQEDAASAFVAEIILNAPRFADDYNAALAEYRNCRGVSGREHPVPDLAITNERCEVPFWLLRKDVPRQRAFVGAKGHDRILITAGADRPVEIERRELSKAPAKALGEALGPAVIRPRALATMMYARLLACDLFIHGIGGAKYDQISDAIIRRYFGIEPPHYACVTATIRLPLKNSRLDPSERSLARRRLRDIRFNPQRFPEHVSSAEVLVQREAAIAESQRLRVNEPRRRDRRKAVYERIHSANAAALKDPESLLRSLREGFAEMEAKAASDRVADSREWFWCLHERAALEGLVRSVSARFAEPNRT